MTRLKPGQAVPPLEVPLLGGGKFKLEDRTPHYFSLVMFYRGLHCAVCKNYLKDLDVHTAAFEAHGVDVTAISADSLERAAQAKQDWNIKNLPIGYALPIEMARKWGLFVSGAVKGHEPKTFVEPGMFLIRPDRTLYASIIGSMPFARPGLNELLRAAEFIVRKGYPARGDS
jgi:peroxiredoxin